MENFPIKTENAEKLYGLAKDILLDFREVAFKRKRTRYKKYRDLFDVVRRAHVEYIDIFSNLKHDAFFSDLEDAKYKFNEKRKLHFTERSLAKFDAHTYLKVCPNKEEKRFLGAVLWYFHYRDTHGHVWHGEIIADMEIEMAIKMGGDSAWDSASTSALFEIESSEGKEEISEIATRTLNYINERYVSVVRYYTYIENSFL